MNKRIEHLIKKISKKKKDSIEYNKILNRIKKEYQKEIRYRHTRTREYSLCLSKVFGDKILNFL